MNKSIRGRKAAPAQKVDLYQQVTDKIIAALEKGVPPWRRPWRSAQNVHGSALPVNATTGRHYSGVNIPLLWMSAEERGFSSDRWLTYQQAKAVGGQVRKGETSSMAIIYKPFEKQATDCRMLLPACRQQRQKRSGIPYSVNNNRGRYCQY